MDEYSSPVPKVCRVYFPDPLSIEKMDWETVVEVIKKGGIVDFQH